MKQKIQKRKNEYILNIFVILSLGTPQLQAVNFSMIDYLKLIMRGENV